MRGPRSLQPFPGGSWAWQDHSAGRLSSLGLELQGPGPGSPSLCLAAVPLGDTGSSPGHDKAEAVAIGEAGLVKRARRRRGAGPERELRCVSD